MRWLFAVIATTVFLGTACSDEDPTPATVEGATPTAKATATATATPEPPIELLGMQVVDLRMRAAEPLTDRLVLYLLSTCEDCDGRWDALVRAYVDAAGAAAIEELYRESGEGYLLGAYLDYLQLGVTVCVRGDCGDGGPPGADAMSRFVWSADSGIVWEQAKELAGSAMIQWATVGPGEPYGIYRQATGGTSPTVRYRIYPYDVIETVDFRGQDPFEALVIPFSSFLFVRDESGVRLWAADSTLNPNITFDFSYLPAGSSIFDMRLIRHSAELMVSWLNDGRAYSAFLPNYPPEKRFPTEIVRWPAGVVPVFARSDTDLSARRMFVTVTTGDGMAPVLVDFETGSVTPVAELADGSDLMVVGLQPWQTALVAPNAVGCATAHSRPSPSADEVGCANPRVLLRLHGAFTDDSGESWAMVSVPGGQEGWIRANSLQFRDAASLNTHAVGYRTGNPDIDPVIALLEANDTVPYEMVAWRDVQCGVGPDPAYTQPCPEGVPAGSTIGGIQVANCEGGYAFRDPAATSLALHIGPGWQLHSIAESDPDWFGGQYALVYLQPEDPRWASVVYVEDGKVAGRWAGCASGPAQVLEYSGPVIVSAPEYQGQP